MISGFRHPRGPASVVGGILLLGLGSPLAAEHLRASAEQTLLVGSTPGLVFIALKEGLRVVLSGLGVLVGVPLVVVSVGIFGVYLLERVHARATRTKKNLGPPSFSRLGER